MKRHVTRLVRVGLACSIAAACPSLAVAPAPASERELAQAAASKQKLKIFKQISTPNAYRRPTVFIDCDKCKGTVTLHTVAKKPRKLGSGTFKKSISDLVGMAEVKLNSRGLELNKKTKVTVLARAKAGKVTVQRKIGMRKAVAPCDLLNAGEVAIIMGEPVDPGTEDKAAVLSRDGRMCKYEASAKRSLVTPAVYLTLVRGYGAGAFKFLRTIYDDPGELTPVQGVGTKAYYVNYNKDLQGTYFISELHAIKGDTYAYVSAPAPAPPGSRPTFLPALLNAAFSRLK